MEDNKTNNSQCYGYVRISDPSQKIDRQIDFMKGLGLDEKNIFIDKQSGKDFTRPAYKKMCRKLKSGDTLYVKELDRLGRNKNEIKEELSKFHNKKVKVRITNIPTTMLDFGKEDWLLETVNNIMVEVLAAIAEQERLVNHQRQAKGIAAARARGVHLGRPYLELPDNFETIYHQWKSGQLKRHEVLDILKIDKVKLYAYERSYLKRLQKQQTNTNNK